MAHELDEDLRSALLDYASRTSDLVGIVDDKSVVLYLNEAARKRFGVGDAEDLTTADLIPPAEFTRYYDEIRPRLLTEGRWSGELLVSTPTGDHVPIQIALVAQVGPGGEMIRIVLHGRERPDLPQESQALAFGFDDLTGLPDRTLLDDRVRVAQARAARVGHRIALVFIDLSAMTEANDALGHAAADNVLRMLARRLLRSVRASDTVARVDRNSFVLLLDDVSDESGAFLLAERVREALTHTPLWTAAGELAVEAHFGLAVGDAETSLPELLARAESAARRPRPADTTGLAVASGHKDPEVGALAEELALAVSHGDIRSYVQPVCDLESDELVGYQGLARWQHRARGLLAASAFIDLAANTATAAVVDLAVLRATASAVVVTSRPGAPLRVYAHVSHRLLSDPRIEQYLTETIDAAGLLPRQVRLVVPHALLARPSRAMADALRAIRDSDVRLAAGGVDANGKLEELVDYRFDELHLDRRLVQAAAFDASQRLVVRGIIGFAHALGIRVAAVGIEDEQQRTVFVDSECDLARGFLYGAPMPADSVE
jgi:diguanylate cyclase (GGDEF)-like protein